MDFKCDELILGKTDADSRALTLNPNNSSFAFYDKQKCWGCLWVFCEQMEVPLLIEGTNEHQKRMC